VIVQSLDHLTIEGLRSIEHVEIPVSDVTVLVGRNNAGKSTVLRAMMLLFLTDFAKWTEDVDRSKQDPTRPCRITARFTVADAPGGASRSSTVRYEYDTRHQWFVDDALVGAKSPQGAAALCDVLFVPVASRIGDDVKTSGPSPYRVMLEDELTQAMTDKTGRISLAMRDLQAAIEAEPGLRRLETDINDRLSDWSLDVASVVATPDAVAMGKSWFTLRASIDGTDLPLDAVGTGAQRAASYALRELQAQRGAEAGQMLQLLLYEEPAANLHPRQVDRLRQAIWAQAIGDDEVRGRQTIVTTHSPRFLPTGIQDLHRVVRLDTTDGRRTASSVTTEQLDGFLRESATVMDGVAKKQKAPQQPEREALVMANLLDPSRTTAFFAETVLLVEGETEEVFLRWARLEGRLPAALDDVDVEIVSCLGKYNLPRLVPLLAAFGVTCVALYDLDDDKGRKYTDHDALNSAVMAACAAAGAARVTLAHDLEQSLGLPKAKERKAVGLMEVLLDDDARNDEAIARVLLAIGNAVEHGISEDLK
jgi:putative ATP-dependent endonuclease of OLD family